MATKPKNRFKLFSEDGGRSHIIHDTQVHGTVTVFPQIFETPRGEKAEAKALCDRYNDAATKKVTDLEPGQTFRKATGKAEYMIVQMPESAEDAACDFGHDGPWIVNPDTGRITRIEADRTVVRTCPFHQLGVADDRCEDCGEYEEMCDCDK
jgi:hypothetical protein